MKIIITKKQYKELVFSLIDNITGGHLTIVDIPDGYYNVFDSFGDDVMSIFYGENSGKSRGCENDLGLSADFVGDLEKYVPYYRHKLFSKVLVDYVYEKTNIKCDCIDYFFYGGVDTHSDNKRFVYNLKKKKKIK